MKQTIRIIGGLYRGKKIHFPQVEGLRPTPDRVKETLFNWLMHDINDANCLDAFAGSGALGLEAFSRGAAQVVFVEQSYLAFQNIKKVITQFNSPLLHVYKEDTHRFLHQCKEQFDIIFLDPPFAQNYLPLSIELITKNNLVRPGGLLYIESQKPIAMDLEQWALSKEKKSGQVVSSLFVKR